MSFSTICDWKNFCRDICLVYYLQNPIKIGGPGIKVQIDESQISKRKYGVGRILVCQDMWIVGGVDENGDVFIKKTYLRNRQVLESIICTFVLPGSIIYTVGWAAYGHLNELGYELGVVNHSETFVTADGIHTNRIESIWGAFKRKYRSITNNQKNMISSYIAEWCFKRKFKNHVLSNFIKVISNNYKV